MMTRDSMQQGGIQQDGAQAAKPEWVSRAGLSQASVRTAGLSTADTNPAGMNQAGANQAGVSQAALGTAGSSTAGLSDAAEHHHGEPHHGAEGPHGSPAQCALGLSQESEAVVAEIIAEFSQVFAFARTRWARYAEEVHSELRGVAMMVLQTIRRKGPITATELSQLLDMDKSVVSRQVSKLRELNLIVAEPLREDRRVTVLSSSTAAEATLDRLHAQTAHGYHERFADWSTDDLEALRAALHRFNRISSTMAQSQVHRCERAGETGD